MAEPDFCTLCNVKLQDKVARDAHYIGKKHQLALHAEHILSKKEKCGVFIGGLPNLITREQIIKFINDFGPTKEIFIGDGNRFALVEYCEESTAQDLIKKQRIAFMDKMVYVKARHRNKQKRDHMEKAELDYEAINNSLKNVPINEQLRRLMSQLQPNQAHLVQAYQSLCRDLHAALQPAFRDCRVYPFGSTITGLNFRYSDVDVYVEVDKPAEAGDSTPNYVKKARNTIPRSKLFSHVLAIPKAKTPIVKCVHIRTQISCDFNFKNMLGVCNSYLVKFYMSLAPQLRTVAMIIKYWAHIHELHANSSKFTNYALIIMLIFYLQLEPFCCESVCAMQKMEGSENIQDGWNGGFTPSVLFNKMLSEKSVVEVLAGFFNFYSQFDYSLNVICPYLGRIVPKADFLRPDILSDDFERYKINLVNMLPLLVDTPICIQDPFEHNHNLTKGVSSRTAEDFKLYCKLAAQIIEQNTSTVEGPLYKLFMTTDPNYEKFKQNEDSCEFALIMGQSLKCLEKKVPKDCTSQSESIRKLWFSMVNEFIIDVLAKVLRCELTVKDRGELPEGISDSVTIHCKMMQNLWDSRRTIRRDIEFTQPSTNLEKEIQLTSYMCDVMCKNITLFEPIVQFVLTIAARDNPMQAEIRITKVSSMKGRFRSLCHFLATRLPHWLNSHEREMNEAPPKGV